MKRHLSSLPLLASSLLAQYTGEPPTTVVPYTLFAPLGATAVGNGVNKVYQARLVPNASLPAYTYYCCLTVGTTTPAATYRLMSGTFNVATGVFTKNTDADGLNTAFTTSELFALSVTNDLLTAAFDAGAGVRYATRPNTASPFTVVAGVVTGIPGTYVDPNLGFVGGKNVLFFTTQSAIQFGDFAAGAVTNLRTVATITGTSVHSPMPVSDKGGTTRSVTFVQTASGAAPFRLMFASSLTQDAGAPPYAYYTDATNWLENGNASGGVVTIISAQNAYVTPYQLGIAGVNSTTYAPATPASVNISSFAPQRLGATPLLAATALGILGTTGTPLGGIITGNLSLTPSFVMLAPGLFDNATGTFEQTIPAPAFPLGTKFWHQTVVCDLAALRINLSNTGKLEWK